MATTEVTGTEATIKKIKEITGKTEAELKTIVKKAAYTVEAVAKEKCPVRTGRLRRSITPRKDSDDFHYIVGTNVEYAAIQENRKHYMAQGATAAQKEFPELVQTSVEKVTKE